MINEENHYTILGISPSATAEEIRQAYLKQALLLHPDKYDANKSRLNKLGVFSKDNATERMKKINAAYEALTSVNKNNISNFSPNVQKNNANNSSFENFSKEYMNLLASEKANKLKSLIQEYILKEDISALQINLGLLASHYRLFINAGINVPNILDKAAYMAVNTRNPAIVRAVLGCAYFTSESLEYGDNNALHQAIAQGDVEIAETILASRHCTSRLLEGNGWKFNALQLAIENRNTRIAETILVSKHCTSRLLEGASILPKATRWDRHTLQLAIENRNARIVKAIFKSKNFITLTTPQKFDYLHMAMDTRNTAIIEAVLEHNHFTFQSLAEKKYNGKILFEEIEKLGNPNINKIIFKEKLFFFIDQLQAYKDPASTLPGETTEKEKKIYAFATNLHKEIDAYFNNPNSDNSIKNTSKNIDQLITDGYKLAGQDRNLKDILACIVLALTGIGLIIMAHKKLTTGSFFLNKTDRQKKLGVIDDAWKKLKI